MITKYLLYSIIILTPLISLLLRKFFIDKIDDEVKKKAILTSIYSICAIIFLFILILL